MHDRTVVADEARSEELTIAKPPVYTTAATAELMRRACGKCAKGVAIAAAQTGSEIVGVTISSFTCVSLEPPLVLFCLHRQSQILPALLRTKKVGISVLASTQRALSERFAVSHERGSGAIWVEHDSGVPFIQDALALFGCELIRSLPAGDHHILLALVNSAQHGGGYPLLRFDRNYCDIKE